MVVTDAVSLRLGTSFTGPQIRKAATPRCVHSSTLSIGPGMKRTTLQNTEARSLSLFFARLLPQSPWTFLANADRSAPCCLFSRSSSALHCFAAEIRERNRWFFASFSDIDDYVTRTLCWNANCCGPHPEWTVVSVDQIGRRRCTWQTWVHRTTTARPWS